MANSIKKKDTYQALRDEGATKQKAAAIANAQTNGSVDQDSHTTPEQVLALSR